MHNPKRSIGLCLQTSDFLSLFLRKELALLFRARAKTPPATTPILADPSSAGLPCCNIGCCPALRALPKRKPKSKKRFVARFKRQSISSVYRGAYASNGTIQKRTLRVGRYLRAEKKREKLNDEFGDPAVLPSTSCAAHSRVDWHNNKTFRRENQEAPNTHHFVFFPCFLPVRGAPVRWDLVILPGLICCFDNEIDSE